MSTKAVAPRGFTGCHIRAVIFLSLSFFPSPARPSREVSYVEGGAILGQSIALLVFWVFALQPPPMDVAVDEGCAFQYLLDAEDEGWTAVVVQGRGARLVPVKFRRNEIVTSSGRRRTVLRLDVAGGSGPAVSPVFLIRGGPAEWRASDFVTWYTDARRVVAGRSEPLGVLFPGERRTWVYEKCDARSLSVYALGEATRRHDEVCLQNYSLHVELADRPGAGQIIYSAPRICGSDLPELLWAGDLDRDEVADLLVRTPVDRESFDVTLYLSHSAEKGEVYRKSATRRIRRCSPTE